MSLPRATRRTSSDATYASPSPLIKSKLWHVTLLHSLQYTMHEPVMLAGDFARQSKRQQQLLVDSDTVACAKKRRARVIGTTGVLAS